MGDKSSLKKRKLERTRFARERGRHEQLRDGEKRNYEERVSGLGSRVWQEQDPVQWHCGMAGEVFIRTSFSREDYVMTARGHHKMTTHSQVNRQGSTVFQKDLQDARLAKIAPGRRAG